MCIVALIGMTHGTTLGSIITDGDGTTHGTTLTSMVIHGMDGILGIMDGTQVMDLTIGIITMAGMTIIIQVTTMAEVMA